MIKSIMEPIEESDLNLEAKIKPVAKSEGLKERMEEASVFEAEKELPREISSAEKDSTYGNILSKVQTTAPAADLSTQVPQDAQLGAQKTDAESMITHLVDIASQKGVLHAVKVAKHMEDNYILDVFHDRLLADELHDALLKKGMLKEL